MKLATLLAFTVMTLAKLSPPGVLGHDDHDDHGNETNGTHNHGHHKHSCVELWEIYVYGATSIIVIWLISFVSVLIIGKIRKHAQYIVLGLRALAVGVLIGDALMHIIPSTLGVHSHEDSHGDDQRHGGGHDHDEEEDDHQIMVLKMCVVVATIFALWMLEVFFPHQHDHGEHELNHNHGHSHQHQHSCNDLSSMERDISNINSTMTIVHDENKKGFINHMKSIKSSGWLAFMGDNLHKVADGIAIGVSYSQSIGLGLSTCLAILFHEIPHELGDFAVLRGAGFSHCGVLLLNSISSFCAMVAFLIIAALEPDEQVRQWIFAVVAGVFLYIAMANIIPVLRKEFEPRMIDKVERREKKRTVIIIGGFIVGWLTMLLIGLFEEDLMIDISSEC